MKRLHGIIKLSAISCCWEKCCRAVLHWSHWSKQDGFRLLEPDLSLTAAASLRPAHFCPDTQFEKGEMSTKETRWKKKLWVLFRKTTASSCQCHNFQVLHKTDKWMTFSKIKKKKSHFLELVNLLHSSFFFFFNFKNCNRIDTQNFPSSYGYWTVVQLQIRAIIYIFFQSVFQKATLSLFLRPLRVPWHHGRWHDEK